MIVVEGLRALETVTAEGEPPAKGAQRQSMRWCNDRATGRGDWWGRGRGGNCNEQFRNQLWLPQLVPRSYETALSAALAAGPPGSLRCSYAEAQWFQGKRRKLTDTLQWAQKGKSRTACQPQVQGFESPCHKLLKSKRSWPHTPGAVGRSLGSWGWFFNSRSSFEVWTSFPVEVS